MNDAPDRPSSAAATGEARSVKRRASKACSTCRTKKVRCSVVRSGIPCYTCRLDNVPCTVNPYRKQRQRRDDPISPLPESVELVDEEKQHAEDETPLGKFLAHPPQSLDFTLSDYVPNVVSPETIGNQEHSLNDAVTTDVSHIRSPASNRARSSNSLFTQSPQLSPEEAVHSVANARLPPYVKALPSTLDSEDVIYLESKGALTVPRNRALTELLRCFAEFVYPFMPMLDLQNFLEPLSNPQSTGKTSLILLHAVCYAAAAFVDEDVLLDEGYSSKRDARRRLFEKTKILYDLEYEQDRLLTLQSLVLMTYYYESPNDRKSAWYWCGISLTLAGSLGIDTERKATSAHDPLYSLRKRLWWSCYMRDQEIAISMRRPPRIRDAFFVTSLLEPEDFDLQPFSPSVAKLLGHSPVVLLPVKTTLATLCIEKTKLCLHISMLLKGQYGVSHEIDEIDNHSNAMLAPRRPGLTLVELVQLDNGLEEWLAERPVECQYAWRANHGDLGVTTANILILHAGILESLFYTASSMLHRQLAHRPAPTETENRTLWQLSRQKVKESTSQLTYIIKQLDDRDLTRFLPPFGVTAVMTAIMTYLINTPPQDKQAFYESHPGICDCANALQTLTHMYASADYARSFLETLARQKGLSILQNVPPPSERNEFVPQPVSPRYPTQNEETSAQVVNTFIRETESSYSDMDLSFDANFDGLEDGLDYGLLNFDGVLDSTQFFNFDAWSEPSLSTSV